MKVAWVLKDCDMSCMDENIAMFHEEIVFGSSCEVFKISSPPFQFAL